MLFRLMVSCIWLICLIRCLSRLVWLGRRRWCLIFVMRCRLSSRIRRLLWLVRSIRALLLLIRLDVGGRRRVWILRVVRRLLGCPRSSLSRFVMLLIRVVLCMASVCLFGCLMVMSRRLLIRLRRRLRRIDCLLWRLGCWCVSGRAGAWSDWAW